LKLLSPHIPTALRGPVVVALHAGAAVGSYAIAFVLRFDGAIPSAESHTFLVTLPALVAIRLASLAIFGVFAASWRHVSVSDLLQLLRGAFTGTLFFVVFQMLWDIEPRVPRSIYGIECLLFILAAGGLRFVVRCAHEGRFSLRAPSGRRTLVIGAGAAAERFVRESGRDRTKRLHLIGLVDDDARVRRIALHGLKVLGTIDDVRNIVRREVVELVVIAIPSASGEQMRRIVRLCSEAAVDYKTVPSLRDMADGRSDVEQLRDVRIEDLLGRAPVQLALDRVERDLAGRTVVITGGAGSIGSELARQVAGFSPNKLILIDQAESALYFVHLELSKAYPALDVVPIVADITNRRRMRDAFAQHQPDVVFHAAAYKHVPLCEDNILEAVRNNVFGTLNLASLATRFRARKFILISSDKAVNPTSVMGTTKRVAERITLGWPRFRKSSTDFRAVRFGNVLGSDGSVVPLFKKQIAEGGPITVTHPDVRRYFMSIPEAVELVLQASALPDASRRILMLEMGEPVRIVDLAEQLVRFSGLVPHKDIRIVFTGLRPGEKLDEELVSESESHERTDVEKVHFVHSSEPHTDELESSTRRLKQALNHSSASRALAELKRLVPEYKPNTANGRRISHPHVWELPRSVETFVDEQQTRIPGISAMPKARADRTQLRRTKASPKPR